MVAVLEIVLVLELVEELECTLAPVSVRALEHVLELG